ncbi:MAG: DoxX family protein [Chloroflexi bacterium]|nr:DoxX family protein [Chloroflexota bacterium]
METLTEPLCDWCSAGWAMVPLRIVLGVIFIHAGIGKLRRGVGGFSSWLGEVGIPLPRVAGPLVASLEIVGGLALIVGLFTSWVAIPLAVSMLVATWVNAVKLRLPFAGNENAQGYELDILMVVALIALMIGGAGPVSLDVILGG